MQRLKHILAAIQRRRDDLAVFGAGLLLLSVGFVGPTTDTPTPRERFCAEDALIPAHLQDWCAEQREPRK